MTDDLVLLLNKDKHLRIAFETVARERRVRLGDLLSLLEEDKIHIRDRLETLESHGLLKLRNSPGGVDELNWYSVTARGLAVERQLKKAHLV